MTVHVEEIGSDQGWRATLDGLVAQARRGRLHGDHGVVTFPEDATAGQLRELAHALSEALGVPLAVKAQPGTDRHALLTAAGATPYQVCPPSTVDCTDPENLAWAQAGELPDGGTTSDLTALSDKEILDLWTDFYVGVHGDWSPVTDLEYAREVFAPMLTKELDRAGSVLLTRTGAPSAVAFVFPEGEGMLTCCEAVGPDRTVAHAAVLACLRAVVSRLGADGCTDLLVDGHVSDPHLYPALQQVPHVTGAGLHLLELG